MRTISEEMGIDADDIKAKWSSLRAQEVRERIKEEKTKTSMSSWEVYLSGWQFMLRIRFVGHHR